MKFNSQAGQDRFVYEILNKDGVMPQGTFLDIGCAGTHWSNSLLFEELGWKGWLIDCHQQEPRKSQFICGDATQIDYSFLPAFVDYLSLDVDEASLPTLKQLLKTNTRFGIITIEHDAWRFGDTQRTPMRELLRAQGYDLVCADVSCQEGSPFEDWHTNPDHVPAEMVEKFRCRNKLWTEILCK